MGRCSKWMIAAICLVWTVSNLSAGEPPEPHSVGEFSGIQFPELAVDKVREKTTRQSEEMGWETIFARLKPTELTYDLYVPKSYRAGLPHGVFICFDAKAAPDTLRKLADERSFLILTPGYVKIDPLIPRAGDLYAAYGFSGLMNLHELYTIDPSRVYVLGHSVAGMVMGLNAPHQIGGVFHLHRYAWHMSLTSIEYSTFSSHTYQTTINNQPTAGTTTDVIKRKRRATLPPNVPTPLHKAEREARSSLRLVFSPGIDFGSMPRPNAKEYIEPLTTKNDPPELRGSAVYDRAVELYNNSGYETLTIHNTRGMPVVIEEGVAFMDQHAEDNLRLVNRRAEEAERKKDLGTALQLYYHAQVLGDEKAAEHVTRLLKLLDDTMQKSRDLRAAGDTEKADKLLKSIMKVYGHAAYDAYVELKSHEDAPASQAPARQAPTGQPPVGQPPTGP